MQPLSQRGDECLYYGHPLSLGRLLGRDITAAQRALETAPLVDAFERRASSLVPAVPREQNE